VKLWKAKDGGACAACAAASGTLVPGTTYPPHPRCARGGGCRCVTMLAEKLADGVLEQRFSFRLRFLDALRALLGRPLRVTTETPVACYAESEGFACGAMRYAVSLRPAAEEERTTTVRRLAAGEPSVA